MDWHLRSLAVATCVCWSGCGSDPSPGSEESTGDSSSGTTAGNPAVTTEADSTGQATSTTPTTTSGSTGDDSPTDTTETAEDSSGGTQSECDYETIDGLIVIEAESLPITKDWSIQTDEPGYYADGYIGWSGPSFNGDPSHGIMEVTIFVAEAGRYRLQWRNRIGMGDNTTEHNDSWVRFPDAADFFGVQAAGDDERRVYPRPICEDKAAMEEVLALPNVIEAECVEGSSTDGWFKVYSSGASDWSWSTRTNDNNGYDVVVEFDEPGDYAFTMAARGDFHLIDRIVIHEVDVSNDDVQDPDATETECTR